MALTLIQTRNLVDSTLPTLWNAIVARQATYLANHNKYWSGYWTHAVAPADGLSVLPDVGAAVPPHLTAADRWPAAELLTAIPYRLMVHEYVGPNGIGFVGYVQVGFGASLYQRSQDSGVEVYRTLPWALVAASP